MNTGLTTKTTRDDPDLLGSVATEHRRAVLAAIRNDAIAAARAHLMSSKPNAAARALAELVKADRRLARLEARS